MFKLPFIRTNSIIGAIIMSCLLSSCTSLQSKFESKVKLEFSTINSIKAETLKESDLNSLPKPVQKYIRYTGAVGNPIPYNFRLEFDADMYRNPVAGAMNTEAVQYSFFQNYSRFFFMKANMFLMPTRVLHAYRDNSATMQVRIASLINAVNLSGEELSRAETVTILNDICVLTPANMTDKRLSWESIDDLSAKVTFKNGPYKVSAILIFNEIGELINFTSEDRSALQEDGSLKQFKWSTPLSEYKNYDGIKLASKGSTIYDYPEGPFTYGNFVIKNIKYNVDNYME